MKKKRYEVSAYLTVEAALVMSVVLLVYLFIVRCVLLQYDRCLLEQESARFLIKCVTREIDKSEKMIALVEEFWDTEQYLWLAVQKPVVQGRGNYFYMRTEGDNPDMGSCQVNYKVWKTDPVVVLRAQRAIQRKQEEEKE